MKNNKEHNEFVGKGICSDCGRRTLVVQYMGELVCTNCVHSNEHLSQMIGWQ